MSSERRIRASRANGALARGRKTKPGIDRSRLNAVKHGAFAKSLVLNNESPNALAKLRDEYLAVLRPTNLIERDLVEEMIVAKWLSRRFFHLENSTVNNKMDEQRAAIEARHHRIPEPIRTAIAHKDLYDNSSALSHIQRSQARNSRCYHRALRDLQYLRSNPQNENEQTTLIPDSNTVESKPTAPPEPTRPTLRRATLDLSASHPDYAPPPRPAINPDPDPSPDGDGGDPQNTSPSPDREAG